MLIGLALAFRDPTYFRNFVVIIYNFLWGKADLLLHVRFV